MKQETISNCDALKKPDSVFEADERVRLFSGDIQRNFDLFYSSINSIKLSDQVPVEVQVHFETAKNTLLYSFYAYRMSTVGLLYGFASLEKGLNIRLGAKKYRGLKDKMRRAVRSGHITLDDIPFSFRSIATEPDKQLDEILHNFCDFRNRLAHDPDYLNILWQSPKSLAALGDLLNKLFGECEPTQSDSGF